MHPVEDPNPAITTLAFLILTDVAYNSASAHSRGLHLLLTINDNSTHHLRSRALLFTPRNTTRRARADTGTCGILPLPI
jgi:hypothetical protein